MNILNEHPKQSKWTVYKYPEETYGQGPARWHNFSGEERHNYNDNTKINPIWTRCNFIFEERMQFDCIGWKGRGYFVSRVPAGEIPNRYVFSPSGFDALLKDIKNGIVNDEGRLIINGTFTFVKQGSTLFTKVYQVDANE